MNLFFDVTDLQKQKNKKMPKTAFLQNMTMKLMSSHMDVVGLLLLLVMVMVVVVVVVFFCLGVGWGRRTGTQEESCCGAFLHNKVWKISKSLYGVFTM